ncbi:MAG: hypothetical protein HGA65_09135, partial [Oscillochloris sp.]|nr:hypothetical protein [Oscillochloris sp.]
PIPTAATRQAIQQAAQARWSIGINPDESEYLGVALEQERGIPCIRPDLPLGVAATARWLAAVAAQTGLVPSLPAQIDARERADLAPLVAQQPLCGARVTLSLPAAYAFGMLSFLPELGAEVVGLTVHSFDQRHLGRLGQLAQARPELAVHIGEGQSFEEANILKRLAPDLHLCWDEHALVALRLGIPALALREIGVLGYRGAQRFALRAARALQNRALAAGLGALDESPYHRSWYTKKPNWYLKYEVK